jgi:tetratricopeptide (TPR) repeat protein
MRSVLTQLAALHGAYWSFDRWYRLWWYIWPGSVALLIIGWTCIDEAGGQTLTSALWGTPLIRTQASINWPEALRADARKCFSIEMDLGPLIEACSRLIDSEGPDSKALSAAYSQRGLHYRLSQPDRALEDYNAALKLQPDAPVVLTNRAWIYMTRKQYETALEDLNRAIDLMPEKQRSGRALYYRGYTLLRMKEYTRALSDLDAVRDPIYNTDMHLARGETLQALKDYRKALVDYDAYIFMAQSDPRGYVLRGSLFEEAGQPKDALVSYNRALTLDPANPQAIAARERLLTILPKGVVN